MRYLLVLLVCFYGISCQAQEPKKEKMGKIPENAKSVVLGGGCFWCLEAVYELIDGVYAVESGYTDGELKNPDYRAVCSGTTGHAEVIKITYAPDEISLKDIVDEFWKIHDPTTLNRQGNDVGSQYRSILVYENEEEKAIMEASLKKGQELWGDPIVTEIVASSTYYPAEDYHQDYYRNNPSQGYCLYVVAPKVQKFEKSTQLKVVEPK